MEFDKVESGLNSFLTKLRYRFEGWTDQDRVRERTFIFPTPFGFAFGFLASLMLMLAVTYSNNLIYLFVFFLVSTGVTAMHLTNRNVDRIKIMGLSTHGLFAGRPCLVSVSITNAAQADSVSLELTWREFAGFLRIDQVEQKSNAAGYLRWQPKTRGYVRWPRLTLASRAPFGLLRAWKIYRSQEQALVYPEPKGKDPFPNLANKGGHDDNQLLFKRFRPFLATDSARRIAWKQYYKQGKLLTREFEHESAQVLQLSLEATQHLAPDFEARLSQLALWVENAEANGYPYSLHVQGEQIATGRGPKHYHKCMTVLALAQEQNGS